MQNFNFWRQLNLFRTKTFGIGFLLLSFLFISSTSEAQWFRVKKKDVTHYNRHAHSSLKRSKRKHLNHPIHYGFFIGGHSSRFITNFSDIYANGGLASSNALLYPTNISPKSSFGFSLGFVVNIKMADFWDLRILPTAAFYERSIDYTIQENVLGTTLVTTQVLESTMAELPILIKYKSQLRGITGMHLVAGIKPGISVTAQKEEEEGTLRATGFDLAVEYGIGFDTFFKFFKFSPEIRFSHGIINNAQSDNNVFAQSLNRLTTNSISLYLHFE